MAEIAAAHPAIRGDRPRRRLGIAEIARHRARPLELELTALALGQLGATLRIADPYAIIGRDRPPPRSRPICGRRGGILERKERLHLARAVKPGETQAARLGFRDNALQRRIERGIAAE